jgi:hypothetical protein
MSKYELLRQFLDCIQSNVGEKTLSFSEIEGILGFKLPKSAFAYREWWSNPSSSAHHPYARSWLAAGWMVDRVNQNDNWVRFRRIQSDVVEKKTPLVTNAPAISNLPEDFDADSSMALTTDNRRFLINFGFEEVGEWLFADGPLQFVLTRHWDEQNILYAFVTQEEVKYIGKSSQTLRGRMNGYKQPDPTQSTNINNNARIKDLLLKGIPVQILAFVQKDEMLCRGLPINLAAGLEDILIARIRPPWNNRK